MNLLAAVKNFKNKLFTQKSSLFTSQLFFGKISAMSIHHYPHYPYLNEEDFNRFQDKYASLQPYPKAKYAATEICARHTLNRIVQIDDAATLAIMIENGADMCTKFSTGMCLFEEAVGKKAYKVMDCLYDHNYKKDEAFAFALWGNPGLAKRIMDELAEQEEIAQAFKVILSKSYKDTPLIFTQLLAKVSEEDIVDNIYDETNGAYLLELVLGSYGVFRWQQCEQFAQLVLDRATNPTSLQAFINQIENAENKYPEVMNHTTEDYDESMYPKLKSSLLKKAQLLKVSVEKQYLDKKIGSSISGDNKEVFRI